MNERERIEQSNEVAGIVFDGIKRVWPDLHPLLDLRYGIADALWDAGYRKTQTETDAEDDDAAREVLGRAIGAVLFNASNFPERVQTRLLGQDMWPLRQRLMLAILDAVTVSPKKGQD